MCEERDTAGTKMQFQFSLGNVRKKRQPTITGHGSSDTDTESSTAPTFSESRKCVGSLFLEQEHICLL